MARILNNAPHDKLDEIRAKDIVGLLKHVMKDKNSSPKKWPPCLFFNHLIFGLCGKIV
jgi:hypothetical protein